MKILLIQLTLVFFIFVPLIVCAEDQSAIYPNALVILEESADIAYSEKYGKQISYQVAAKYPADEKVKELNDKIEKKGFTKIEFSYLNPHLKSSHVIGWESYGVLDQPNLVVHQWLAQWENTAGEILFGALKYYENKGEELPSSMHVYLILHVKASIDKELTEHY